MSKHIQYGKTFGLFYDAYRKFCRENSPDGKPNSETPEMFRQPVVYFKLCFFYG